MSTSEEGCCESSQVTQVGGSSLCPECKDEGISVSKVTVGHLVRDEYHHLVSSDRYKVCMAPGCDVVYFGADDGTCFTKEQVKVPIWFKDGASPKYACYCSKVTEDQVLDAVIYNSAESLKDVIALTGAMKNPNCLENNPLGVCCHKTIGEAIAKGRSMR